MPAGKLTDGQNMDFIHLAGSVRFSEALTGSSASQMELCFENLLLPFQDLVGQKLFFNIFKPKTADGPGRREWPFLRCEATPLRL